MVGEMEKEQTMIDKAKIFPEGGTDIGELLLALVDKSNPIEDRRELWREWCDIHYNLDEVIAFFWDSLFFEGENYSWVFCNNTEHRNFYELAMSLDMANIDPKAYYLYWILNYTHFPSMQSLVKEALEYDPDMILGIFPDVREIVIEDKEQK